MSESNLPSTPSTRNSGRARHKPGCECPFCKNSRKRAEKAQPEPDRERGVNLLPLPKDGPVDDPNVIQGDGIIKVPSRTQRDHIAQWALLRAQGMKNPEIAAKLGIQTNTLSAMISRATQAGWLKFDNPSDRLQYELAPNIVDNIEKALYAGSEKMTIEAAKGIGLFKSYQAVKVDGPSQSMVLALKIETPEGYSTAITAGNAVFGTARTIDAEVVEEDKEK